MTHRLQFRTAEARNNFLAFNRDFFGGKDGVVRVYDEKGRPSRVDIRADGERAIEVEVVRE